MKIECGEGACAAGACDAHAKPDETARLERRLQRLERLYGGLKRELQHWTRLGVVPSRLSIEDKEDWAQGNAEVDQ